MCRSRLSSIFFAMTPTKTPLRLFVLALLASASATVAGKPSSDITWMNGEIADGRWGISFLTRRATFLPDSSIRILDTISLGGWDSQGSLLGPFRIHRGTGNDSARWIVDTAIFDPPANGQSWNRPENKDVGHLWIDGNIHADHPYTGSFSSTQGVWKNALLDRQGNVVSGTNLLRSTVGDTSFLEPSAMDWPSFAFLWKSPPGAVADFDSIELPPLCTLWLHPRPAATDPGAFHWLDGAGEEISSPVAVVVQRQGPFPVLRARWGETEWSIELDSTNFRQPTRGDLRGTVRIRPYPGQPMLTVGRSLGEARRSRFDTLRLSRPITRTRSDGWEESIVSVGWEARSRGRGPMLSAAGSRRWKNGARSFRTNASKARERASFFDEHHPEDRRTPSSDPYEGYDWLFDTLVPPLDPRATLPWVASPPIWDTSSPLEMVGMGTARLDPTFWWTHPDTLETIASIVLSPDWRRTLGRDSLRAWVRLHRPRDQILSDTAPWRPRLCQFRIRVGEYQEFRLADSSFLVSDDKPLFWTSSCMADSLTMRLEGPVRLGQPTQSTYKATRRYRRAVATARGMMLDSGAADCRILSRANGITFTVDEVDQKQLQPTGDDSGWITSARSIAREGIERSFPDPYDRPEVREEDLHPIASHRGNAPLVGIGENPFVGTFLLAWNQHLPVRISPDQVWMAILDGVSLHIAKEPERWRKRLKIGRGGKREIKLILDPEDYANRDSVFFWEKISQRLLEAMPDSTQQLLEEHFLAKYSTTTPTIEVAYRMKILESVQPFFDYAGSVECGIPRITLEGTPEDWIQLRTRARRLGKLGFSKWMESLEPVFTEFVQTSQGAPALAFWRSFFRQYSSGGCDMVYHANGWITRFFPLERNYGDLRFRDDLSETLDLRFVPKGAGSFPFTLVDRTRPTQPKHRYRITSGFVGVAQDSATGDLSPDIGWAVFEDSTKVR